ncbi:unnamed protein product [Chrysoparadoxa australica]
MPRTSRRGSRSRRPKDDAAEATEVQCAEIKREPGVEVPRHKMSLRSRRALSDISNRDGASKATKKQKSTRGSRVTAKAKEEVVDEEGGEEDEDEDEDDEADQTIVEEYQPELDWREQGDEDEDDEEKEEGEEEEVEQGKGKGPAKSEQKQKLESAVVSRQAKKLTADQQRRCRMEPVISKFDLIDKDNPHYQAEYVTQMFARYKELERKYSPTVYMHTQSDINSKMRAILIDWIVEVHLKFKLSPPTLYLACHLIDRYCMLETVHRNKLQLVGVTALFIACKYEEIYPPEVRDCVYITDHAYSRAEVLDMEQRILKRLRFEIAAPTAYNFLSRYLNVSGCSELMSQRAHYYSERCLQEHDMLSYRPSLTAATAVFLARLYEMEEDQDAEEPWSSTLAEICNMSEDMLRPCAHMMLNYLSAEPVTANRRRLVAVKKKFSQEKFLCVSLEDLPSLSRLRKNSS